MALLSAVVIKPDVYPLNLALAFKDALVKRLALNPILDKALEFLNLAVCWLNVSRIPEPMDAVLHASYRLVEFIIAET